MKPPGVRSLVPMEELRLEEVEGYCDHPPTHGRWAIKWEGKFYVFDPPTGLQKDIWLGEAKKKIGAAPRRGSHNRTHRFVGVYPNVNVWEWVIQHNKRRIREGGFASELAAAKERDAYIVRKGLPHQLNFKKGR